ncbi:hypothetical protein V8C26DRAFT_414323 [Trichoderma gracile]
MEPASRSHQGEFGHASTHLAISIWGQGLPLRRCEPDEAERGGGEKRDIKCCAFHTNTISDGP